MAAAEAPPWVPVGDVEAHVKLMCSHGGRLVSCSPGGATRYVGGETRVLAVSRAATFSGLVARLSSEMAGGVEVRAVRHRLADDEDILVSVSCDEELAHMLDEYDRLRAKRPNAAFRVFVSTASSRGSAGVRQRRVPLTKGFPLTVMRRVQSEPVLVAACADLHRRLAYPDPAPTRRAQSAQELATAKDSSLQPSLHHGDHHCRYVCHRRTRCAAAPPPAWSVYALPCMSKNVNGLRSGCQGPSPVVSSAAKGKRNRRDAKATMDMEKRRAIWEFE